MLDAIKYISALVAMRLGAAGWFLLKAAILIAIVVGAGSEIIDLAPAAWPPFELSFRVLSDYARLAFLTASNNWQIISLALLFYGVWALVVPFVTEIQSHAYQTKVAAVAIANYLDIQVETDATKALQGEGWKGIFKDWPVVLFLWLVFGHRDDDSLSAKAVRWGSKVSLQEDIKGEVKAQVEETSKRMESSITDHFERQMEMLASRIENILNSRLG